MAVPINLDGIDYQANPLDGGENADFDQAFAKIIAGLGPGGAIPNTYAQLLAMRKEDIRKAVGIAKEKMQATFKTWSSDTSIALARIRPWHLRRTTAAGAETPYIAAGGGVTAAANLWTYALPAAAGVNAWLGWGAAYVNVNRMDRDCMVVIVGMMQAILPPLVEDVQFTIDNHLYPWESINDGAFVSVNRDNQLIAPIKTKIIPPQTNYAANVYANNVITTTCVLIPVGVTIARGSFLAGAIRAVVM